MYPLTDAYAISPGQISCFGTTPALWEEPPDHRPNGVPTLVYRWFFGAHSLKALRHNIPGLCGIRPVKAIFLDGVKNSSEHQHYAWLTHMRSFGTSGNPKRAV